MQQLLVAQGKGLVRDCALVQAAIGFCILTYFLLQYSQLFIFFCEIPCEQNGLSRSNPLKTSDL